MHVWLKQHLRKRSVEPRALHKPQNTGGRKNAGFKCEPKPVIKEPHQKTTVTGIHVCSNHTYTAHTHFDARIELAFIPNNNITYLCSPEVDIQTSKLTKQSATKPDRYIKKEKRLDFAPIIKLMPL